MSQASIGGGQKDNLNSVAYVPPSSSSSISDPFLEKADSIKEMAKKNKRARNYLAEDNNAAFSSASDMLGLGSSAKLMPQAFDMMY